MKPAHIEILSKLQANDELLLSELIKLLTSNSIAERMTFEELMECCSEQPTLIIKPAILIKVALKYSKGEENFTQSNQKAFQIFCFAYSKKEIVSMAVCGIYYYDGRAGKVDYDQALKLLLEFYSVAQENNKNSVAYWLGIIYLIKNQFVMAQNYLQKVPENNQYKPTAIKLLSVITQNILDPNYSHLCYLLSDIFYKEGKRKEALEWLLKINNGCIKESANQLFDKILQDELHKLYSRINFQNMEDKMQVDRAVKEDTSLPGWIKKIKGTLLDGYDKNYFSKQIAELTSKIEKYRQEILEAIKNSLIMNEELEYLEETGESLEGIKTIKGVVETLDNKQRDAETEKKKLEAELAEIVHAGKRKELQRQYYVQKRFFNPKRTSDLTAKNIALAFQSDRFYSGNTPQPQQLADIPSRRIITAERSTLEAIKDISTTSLSNTTLGRNRLGWIPKESISDWAKKKECIMLGNTEIKYYQDPSPYENHLGNYFMDNVGRYKEIEQYFNWLTKFEEKPKKENEQRLACLMLKYAKTGAPITILELKEINDEVKEDDVNKINTLFYHILIKEVVRRMQSSLDIWDIPAAIIQARAIKLIAAGYLSIKDVFSQDAPYGIVTGEGLYFQDKEVKVKMKRVNSLYNAKILTEKYQQQASIFFSEHPGGTILASWQELHTELKETYGAENDTDDEGYSSSEEQGYRLKL